MNLQKCKYNFSQDFSEIIYAFSEANAEVYFKEFNVKFKAWMETHKTEIGDEIERIKQLGFKGSNKEIEQKIKISARFYYRKKTKQQDKKEKTVKSIPKKVKTGKNIGLSQGFIKMMDENIHENILAGLPKKMKILFERFTQANMTNIAAEIQELKGKYEEQSQAFVPEQIAKKIKKSFENRCSTLFL